MLILINGSATMSFKMDGTAKSVKMNEVLVHRAQHQRGLFYGLLWPPRARCTCPALVSAGQLDQESDAGRL